MLLIRSLTPRQATGNVLAAGFKVSLAWFFVYHRIKDYAKKSNLKFGPFFEEQVRYPFDALHVSIESEKNY